MTRLTDERVLQIQEDEGAGRVGNPEYEGGEDLDSLFRDHLRAREDVKRLAAKVRKLATYHEAGDHTPLCWSSTGCCVRPGGVPSRHCVEIRVLLSEVGQ